jgi:hypothetical protein
MVKGKQDSPFREASLSKQQTPPARGQNNPVRKTAKTGFNGKGNREKRR